MEYGGYTLIYLEPDVQINLVVEKISESTSQWLAFVVHHRCPLLYSRVNLELIRKRLEEEEKEGVFVTSHPQLKNILQRDNWSVYSHLEDLEGGHFPEILELKEEEILRPLKKRRKRKRILSLLLLLSMGFFILIYLNARAVVIEITPARKIYSQEMVFRGDFTTSLSSHKGVLPLHCIPISKELVERFEATGKRVMGLERASGSVRIINEDRERTYVPSGTLLKSRGGVEFVTLNDVWVPGVHLEYLLDVVIERRNGWVDVNIEAIEKGERGNVQAGEIREWAHDGPNLHVINPNNTSGGLDETVLVITEEDLERGKEEMERRLLSYVKEKLREEVDEGHVVVRDLHENGLIEIESGKELAEKGSFFLTGRIEGETLYLYKEDLEYLVAKTYTESLSSEYRLSEHPLEIESIYMELEGEDSYTINLSITGEVVAVIDREDLEASFKGAPIERAQETLRTMPEVDGFRIVGENRERLPSFALGLRVIVHD